MWFQGKVWRIGTYKQLTQEGINVLSLMQHQTNASDPSAWKGDFIPSDNKTASVKTVYSTSTVPSNTLRKKKRSQGQEQHSNLAFSSEDLETEGHPSNLPSLKRVSSLKLRVGSTLSSLKRASSLKLRVGSTLPSLKRASSLKLRVDVRAEMDTESHTFVCSSDQKCKAATDAAVEKYNESLITQDLATASINTNGTVSMAKKSQIFPCCQYTHRSMLWLDG